MSKSGARTSLLTSGVCTAGAADASDPLSSKRMDTARAGFSATPVLIQDVPGEVVTYPDSPKPMLVCPPSLASAPMPYLEHRKDRETFVSFFL